MWLIMALSPLAIFGWLNGINLIDAWWNFALGHLMLEQHQLVTIDQFSFTPTVADAINQQWLAQLAWAAAYDVAGPAGAYALLISTILVTTLTLWSIGRMLGASRRALVAAALIAAFQLTSFFQVRAQLFAFALAAAALWCLQRGGRTAWLVVPLTAVWANVHGSFPLASCFAAAFAIGSLTRSETRRRAIEYAAIAVGAGVASLLNPYGPQVWRYAVELSSNETLRSSLTEWAPTTAQDLTGKFFFVSLSAGIGLLAWRRPRIPITWLLLSCTLAAFALTAVRNIPWFDLVSLPVWALMLTKSFPSLTDHVTRPRTLLPMTVAVLSVLIIGGFRITGVFNPGPNAAVSNQELALSELSSYLQQHPEGPLFNEANWGAYLEAHLSPARQVFIDTRFEVHPVPVWDDYKAVAAGRFDWESILDKYGIQQVAIDPESSPNLAHALEASGKWSEAWHIDYGASNVVVWSRTPSSS
jgi:hypothetical protein